MHIRKVARSRGTIINDDNDNLKTYLPATF